MGILLISVLVYSFYSAANLASSYDTSIADSDIQNFNSNFEKNAIGGKIQLQDIITMAHFANDYNKKNGAKLGDTLYISVYIRSKLITAKDPEKSNEAELIDDYIKKDEWLYVEGSNKQEFQKYDCKIEYDDTGRVKTVICEKV